MLVKTTQLDFVKNYDIFSVVMYFRFSTPAALFLNEISFLKSSQKYLISQILQRNFYEKALNVAFNRGASTWVKILNLSFKKRDALLRYWFYLEIPNKQNFEQDSKFLDKIQFVYFFWYHIDFVFFPNCEARIKFWLSLNQ